MFSSRQRIGAVRERAQFWQFTGLATFGNGSRFTIAVPAFEIWPAGTIAAGAPAIMGVGSQGLPLASLPGRKALKLPPRSAAVGTVAVRALPRSSRFHSCDQKT